MEHSIHKAPLWIIILSLLLAVLGISISTMMYLTPPNTFIPQLDPHNSGVHYLNAMCAARQLSVALCLGFAALRRSTPMLILSWFCYLLLNIQDAAIGYSQHDSSMTLGGVVISLLAILIIYVLTRKKV